MHSACLLANPTLFYKVLAELHNRGSIVGPVFTNNFDGLCLGIGLEEYCLRQYDTIGVYPPVFFHPQAKSLIVIGSHADRRTIQAQARKQGLQIIFIDPEGYNDGTPYPLESPQDNDILVQMPAVKLKELLT